MFRFLPDGLPPKAPKALTAPAAPGLVTAAWVYVEAARREPAYTTVVAVLTGPYEKQAVTRTRTGRSPGRTPVAGAAGPVALRVRKLPGRRGDRDAVLSGFCVVPLVVRREIPAPPPQQGR